MTDRSVNKHQQPYDKQNRPNQQEEQRTPEQVVNDPKIQRQYDELDAPNPDPDEDQYGNLDEPDMDLYGNLEDLEMGKYVDRDAAAQDQFGSQNPIGSENEPDTPGGQGTYDVKDQHGPTRDIVQPGSNKDQYGTRGSQDQYGDQQDVQ
jgi:hypothetical protein